MPHKKLDLELLPYRESFSKGKDPGGWGRGYGKGVYKRIGDYFPYTIVSRVLKEFIGKPVDDAFSKYCKIVPVYQQQFFWDEIKPKRPRWRNIVYYFIDENGLIQKNNKEVAKTIYKIPSFDIEYGYINYETGDTKTRREHNSYIHSRYSWGIIKGKLYEFEHKNYLYYKCFYEQQFKKRKLIKQKAKEQREKQYSFLTKSELEIINNRKDDIINRDRHGFDDMSFKNRAT